MGFELQPALQKLYGLSTVIFREADPGVDLVNAFYTATPIKPAPKLEQLDTYLFERSVASLHPWDQRHLIEKRFPLGFVKASALQTSLNYESFLTTLLQGYPETAYITSHFIANFIVADKMFGGSAITQDVTPDDLHDLISSSLQLHSSYQPDPKFEKRVYPLLRLFAEHFSDLNEFMSYDRLSFFTPHISTLADKPEVKRGEIIFKMLHREFPFDESSKEVWRDHIRSF